MTIPTTSPTCVLCGAPMPPGEEMFKYHGFSGPCPKPPLPLQSRHARALAVLARMRTEVFAECTFAEEVEAVLRDLLVWVDTLQQERDEARNSTRFLSQQHPCVICGWPRPHDNEHNICECCGFQEGYDAPDLYRWDGAWWAKDRERQPKILRAAEAQLAHLTARQARLRAAVQHWRENARRAQANAENKQIPALDRRQCGGVSQAYEQCADELDQALAEAPQP